jgi:hypothetical protein
MRKSAAVLMLAAWILLLGLTAAEAQQQGTSPPTKSEWICPVTGKPAGMGKGQGGRGQCMQNRGANCPAKGQNCPYYSQGGRRGMGAGRSGDTQGTPTQ